MAKQPKRTNGRAAERTLRDAFKAVEEQPVPIALTELVETLSAPKRRPDDRS